MKYALLLLTTLLLAACSSNRLALYQEDRIQFDPTVFFNGQLVAEGIVRSRSGKVIRYFEADIDAVWNEDGGTLDEVFRWNDGEVQTRVWQFTRTGPNTYAGTAGDVVGEATLKHAGNAIKMNYVLDVPLDNGKSVKVNIRDWLYQINGQSIMNVTTMKKFGLKVGDVMLTIRAL